MVNLKLYGLGLILCLLICFCTLPLVECSEMERTWGTEMVLSQYLVVGNGDEIPVGNWGYVFQKQDTNSKIVPKNDWEAMLSGDLSQLANQIRQQIPGAEPVWIRVSWDSAIYDVSAQRYYVEGLMVEALVKNAGAGQTGAEIVLIIMAIAILVAVLTICLTGAWVTWKVVDATEKISPWLTIIVGLVILVGIGVLLFVFLGGKAKYKGKKRSITIGKG